MKREDGQGRYVPAAVITVLLFHVTAALLVFYLGLFRADFLIGEREKYGVPDRLGITAEELDQVTEKMTSYVRGRAAEPDVTVNANGEEVSFFTERDRMHLADIAEMVRRGRIYCAIGAAAAAAGFLFLWKQGKRKLLCGTYLASWPILGLGAAALGSWIARDLQGFINGFHRLFLQNDRWILNPATDRLIWLFPAQLFRDGAVFLAVWLAAVHLAVTAAAVLLLKDRPGKKTGCKKMENGVK